VGSPAGRVVRKRRQVALAWTLPGHGTVQDEALVDRAVEGLLVRSPPAAGRRPP